MRIILVLLALTFAGFVPSANAGDGTNCPGTVTVTSKTPASVSTGPTLDIRVVFTGDGPGYIPDQCDIGWITTCSLVVNSNPVNATCRHTDGDDRCHELSNPYVCEVEMTASLATFTGNHNIQATLGITWGCCLWQGGPEATNSTSWSVYHVKTL